MNTDKPAAPVEPRSFVHPDGRLHDVGGHHLWVEQAGAGETVVLLSGLGPAGSHVIFHPHFDALAADHRVVYVDLHGRGRSDVPADLRAITFESDVADVAALLRSLDVGPVHLYGFSYGGLLAQALSLDHPALVRTLVLANSLHSPEMWQQNHANINRELANQCPDVWARIEAMRAEGIASTDPRMQREFAVAAPLVRFFNPESARRLATEPGARNAELYPLFCGDDVDFIIGGEVARIPDFRPRLKDVSVPMLVLAGRFDRALYPALQRQFLTFAPSAEFRVLERSGSFAHVEEPDEVLRILRAFWARAEAPRVA
ncbi:alpha/beta fold hydrolase [Polyangium sorediatum]|uniref:Alpha/beta hydrolase n=1 Tax=Polyangium sorediatum TaxID=889274 RepID=A0ABT6NSX6_9BACT|nr:alpha/beta hydrolase [Polyangium sorediatum]MDI1431434.1 alpha/beta hydrolase [Polyangium sorediatum]